MDRKTDFTHDNPFTVPEGYFDTIASRVMERLPAHEVRMIVAEEKKKKTFWLPQWARYGAAAAVVAAICMAGVHFMSNEPSATSPVSAVTMATYSSDDNIDAMADYIMADDQDLYAYISGE